MSVYIYIYVYVYQNRILTIEDPVRFGMSRSAVRLSWGGLSGPERSLKSTFENDYFIASRGLRALGFEFLGFRPLSPSSSAVLESRIKDQDVGDRPASGSRTVLSRSAF